MSQTTADPPRGASSGSPVAPVAPDLLRRRATELPDRTPLEVDGDRRLTYAEWDHQVDRVANGLLSRGVRVGDRIGLDFGGMAWADYAIAYLAALRAGAVVTHFNPGLGEAEIARRLVEANPVGVISGGTASAPPGRGWRSDVAGLDSGDAAPVQVRIRPEDLSDIYYTSGTTGTAKAVLVPHGNLSYGRGLNKVAADAFDAAAPIVSPMPLGTSSSAGTVAIFALTTTSVILVSPPGDIERIAALCADRRAGSLMLTPGVIKELVDTRAWERHDLSSVTMIGVASGHLPSRYGRAILEAMPQTGIMVAYGGGTEAVPANLRGQYDPADPSCVGSPSPGTEISLRGEDDLDVAEGTIGRVAVKHQAPLRRYLNPFLDDGVFEDGWIVTNDLARKDPTTGLFHFVDRGEDAIHTAAGLVSSLEVENALYEHSDVRDTAAVAVGETGSAVVAAAVVLAAGSSATDTDVLRVARRLLAPHATPTRVVLVPEIVRSNQSGKALKRLVRQQLLDAGDDVDRRRGGAPAAFGHMGDSDCPAHT